MGGCTFVRESKRMYRMSPVQSGLAAAAISALRYLNSICIRASRLSGHLRPLCHVYAEKYHFAAFAEEITNSKQPFVATLSRA